jgi:hypothetical protein
MLLLTLVKYWIYLLHVSLLFSRSTGCVDCQQRQCMEEFAELKQAAHSQLTRPSEALRM